MRAIEKLGQQPLALLDRLPPQILAFEFEQVEPLGSSVSWWIARSDYRERRPHIAGNM